MNARKNMLLIVGLGISGLLIAGSLFFLFKFQGRYRTVKQDLESSLSQLERLQRRDPYPSPGNVESTRKQAEVKEGFFETLMDNLREGEIREKSMERAQFGTILESTTRELRLQANNAGVKFPEQFAFGFDRYEMGSLAQSRHIPRLYAQLKTIEQLSLLLFEHGVKELVEVERERFDEEKEEVAEEPSPRSRRARRRRAPEPQDTARGGREAAEEAESDLFKKEPVTFTFYTREDGLWSIMDALATADPFTVVTSVTLANEDAEGGGSEARRSPLAGLESRPPRGARGPGMPGEEGGTGEAEEEEPPSRDERVVAGRERVKVELSVEVYRFSAGEEEAAEATEDAS